MELERNNVPTNQRINKVSMIIRGRKRRLYLLSLTLHNYPLFLHYVFVFLIERSHLLTVVVVEKRRKVK